MVVVIFKARIRALDADYAATAQAMRQLAIEQFNCIAFEAVTEGDAEIALSYWHSEDDIRAWKQHPAHLAVQRQGRERWYASYSVEVARIERHYAT